MLRQSRDKKSLDAEAITMAMAELGNASDRAVGIVAATFVQTCLTATLRERLYFNRQADEQMFGGMGPLGTFSAQINLGLMIGVYSDMVRKELHAVRKIRNSFAHDLGIRSFSDPEVRDKAMSLRIAERYTADQDSAESDFNFDRKQPISKWPYWQARPDLDLILSDPKERFLLECQALTWLLSHPPTSGMAVPPV
jgi:hypothetical protein